MTDIFHKSTDTRKRPDWVQRKPSPSPAYIKGYNRIFKRPEAKTPQKEKPK